MVAGLVSIAAGVVVLLKPSDSLVTLVVIAGIFILVDGFFDLFASFSRATENRGLTAVLSVLSIVIGVLLIRHPVSGVLAAALLIGIWLMAAGIVRIIRAFDSEHRVWGIIVGVIYVAAGIVIVSSPPISFATLALLVGIAFIVSGVGQFALGLALHGLQRVETPAYSAGAPA
jgi:uncharacterized membrane protein HdeD (DUF308 family)